MRLATALALLSAVAATAAAQGASRPPFGQSEPIRPASVRESFVSSVRVSGATRVGLMAGDPAAPITPGLLSVLLPSSATTGMLCIRLLSADGQYEARITDSLARYAARTGSGATPIEYPSRYIKELGGLRAADVAIEATHGPTCEARDAKVLVASWQPAIDRREIWLVVNSGQMRTQITAVIGDTTRSFACVPVVATRKIAFDVRCPIRLAADERPATLTISRRRLSNQLPPIPVPIEWP